MADSITVDAIAVIRAFEKMGEKAIPTANKALNDVASEILRLSQREVPHDKGTLQNSGNVSQGASQLEVKVGYNTPYAGRLHEHPEFHFQKGRKGKYLEDPVYNEGNMPVFQDFFEKKMREVLDV